MALHFIGQGRPPQSVQPGVMDLGHTVPRSKGCWGHRLFIFPARVLENARQKGDANDLGQLIPVTFMPYCPVYFSS